MRNPVPLFLCALSLFLAGCEGPISIESHGDEVAARIGVDVDQLKFVSRGDVAWAEDLNEGYSEKTKGVLAITNTHVYWSHEGIETVALEDMTILPIEQIESASWDEDLMQFRIDGELFIFRPHAWNRYEGDFVRAREVLNIIKGHEIPLVATTRSYRSPADVHTSHGTGLYGETDPEQANANDNLQVHFLR